MSGMGKLIELCCPKCHSVAASKTEFRCPACRLVREAVVAIDHLSRDDFARLRQSRDLSIWRWFDFFPVENHSSIVSLGEGSTPLIPANRLGEKLGIANLYLKNDTVLPTGSLKDRSNSVGLSVGKELGFATASVISTGNAAASVAAYAAAAGMNSVVMVPKGTATSKIIQAHAYGATVIVVDGRFDYEVAELYKNAVMEFGWYDCLSSNPYRVGKKSYAYELVDQLDGMPADWVIHPTAGGTGLVCMWQGFKEFLALGWIDRAPKLVAAQSEAAAPFVAAMAKGSMTIEAVEARATVAESIQVGNPSCPRRSRPGGVAPVARHGGGVERRRNPRSAVADRPTGRHLRRAGGGDLGGRGEENARYRSDPARRCRGVQSHRPRIETAGSDSLCRAGVRADRADAGRVARAVA